MSVLNYNFMFFAEFYFLRITTELYFIETNLQTSSANGGFAWHSERALSFAKPTHLLFLQYRPAKINTLMFVVLITARL